LKQTPPNPDPVSVHSTSWKTIVKHFGSDKNSGVDEADADSRRERYGWNQMLESRPVPAWKRLASQFKELVIWILVVAALIAGAMGEWIDTFAILAIVVNNGLQLGFSEELEQGITNSGRVLATAS